MNLPIEIIVTIFSFLKFDELCNCEKVCRQWYLVLLSSNSSSLYSRIDFRKQNDELPIEWLYKKLVTHKTRWLNLSGISLKNSTLKDILIKVDEFIEYLDLSFQIITLDLFTHLNLYKLSSVVINDANLKDSCLENLLRLPILCNLNINYNSTLNGKPFSTTDKPLNSLWFEGCEHIEYSYIYSFVKSHGLQLKELGIDGEYYSSSQVCSILNESPNLNKFAIEYANEMDETMGEYLLKSDWEHLKIRRALIVPRSTYANLFRLNLTKILYLNLAECTYIDDSICISISSNCPNLKSFILTWCSDVSDLGISSIILNCQYLNYLDLTGLKEITSLSFPLECLPVYNHINTIILEKCNKISDDHLWQLSGLYPSIRIKNYYGEFKDGWTGSLSIDN